MHSMTSALSANPRYPLISELKQILLDTYYGRDYVEGETAAKKKPLRLKLRKSEKIRLISSAVWQHKRPLLGPFFCFLKQLFHKPTALAFIIFATMYNA